MGWTRCSQGATKPFYSTTVKATKSISFTYSASNALSSLFEDFRHMCNEAIRVAVQEKPKNRFKLIELAYAKLKEYGLHTHYLLSACEVAYSAYRNRNRNSIPCVRRLFLKIDNQSYQLNHMLLRIPTTPKKFVFLTLQGSERYRTFIDDPSLKRGSVIVTPYSVVIPLSKDVKTFEPVGFSGIDINERNATLSATNGWHQQFNELGEVVEIKARYREIRASISQKTKGDGRIAKELLTKFGKRENHRTKSRLHKVTRQVVLYAKEHKLGIKMEMLKGIRKLYRKGNGQSRSFRGE